MKQCPQLIFADDLRKERPMAAINGGKWFLARPLSCGGLITRARLAWGVFTGKYDALKWGLGQ